RLSPARAASHVCVQPSCEDTGFDMLRRFDTEAADVIGIFQAVIGLVFFPRVLADSEETLLRKVPMRGSKVGKEEVAINAWRRETDLILLITLYRSLYGNADTFRFDVGASAETGTAANSSDYGMETMKAFLEPLQHTFFFEVMQGLLQKGTGRLLQVLCF